MAVVFDRQRKAKEDLQSVDIRISLANLAASFFLSLLCVFQMGLITINEKK